MLNRLRGVFDFYIVLMLATVALATLLPAAGQAVRIASLAADGGIVLLFFLYGTRLSPRVASDGLRQWRLQLAILFVTFALFPALGGLVIRLAPSTYPPSLLTGVVFLSVLPSTVQSSIAFTSIARGNVAAALCAASASNLLGVFITPLLAGWLLHTQGGHLSTGMFRDITLQLLAPFLAGQLLRPWIGGWIAVHKRLLAVVDRGSILLIIYVTFSKGMGDRIWSQIGMGDLLILAALLAALLGASLLLTQMIGRRLLGLAVEDEIVLQFCGSKKSLASGVPMASVIFPGSQLGLIVLPLMLFHQLQLIVCAILARRYDMRPRTDANPAIAPEISP